MLSPPERKLPLTVVNIPTDGSCGVVCGSYEAQQSPEALRALRCQLRGEVLHAPLVCASSAGGHAWARGVPALPVLGGQPGGK